MIKVGIVGVRGLSVVGAMKAMPDEVKITAICDLDQGCLDWAKGEIEKDNPNAGDLQAYRIYEDMIEKADIDAVVISTPMQCHVPQAITALQAGKHVMCEVTAGVTMDELWWLIENVEKSGKIYMYAENYCYMPDCQLVRALVGKGLTGQIRDLPSFVWDGDLLFSSGRVRFATEGVQVTVNGDLTLAGDDSRLEIGGCAATNWAHHTVLYSGVVPCGLTVNGDLTLSGTSRLDIRSAATAGHSGTGATVKVSGQMTVATNCRVYAWSDVVTLGSPAFTVGGLDLQAGALFSADARGGRGGFNGDVSAYVGARGRAAANMVRAQDMAVAVARAALRPGVLPVARRMTMSCVRPSPAPADLSMVPNSREMEAGGFWSLP